LPIVVYWLLIAQVEEEVVPIARRLSSHAGEQLRIVAVRTAQALSRTSNIVGDRIPTLLSF
jgi:hypothetical protein